MNPSELYVDFSSDSPDRLALADRRASALFAEYGAFVASGLLGEAALLPIKLEIQKLIKMRIVLAGGSGQFADTDGLERFDNGFVRLAKADRKHGSVIYDACPRLKSVHQISTTSRLLRLSESLMQTDMVMAETLKTVRIDHANEDRFLFPWHQDYPYIQDSEDGIVYWFTLHDVDETNGAIQIALGSHLKGILPVRVSDSQNLRNNRALTLEIDDPSEVNRYPVITVPVKQGDVLVFSTLLLHSSSPNRSTRPRWTIQIRHGNFRHPKAITRSWPGQAHHGYPFYKTHPEYVTNVSEVLEADGV